MSRSTHPFGSTSSHSPHKFIATFTQLRNLGTHKSAYATLIHFKCYKMLLNFRMLPIYFAIWTISRILSPLPGVADRFSWIGRLEFDSLRQVCVDPSGRGHVGSEPPMCTAAKSPKTAKADQPRRSGRLKA